MHVHLRSSVWRPEARPLAMPLIVRLALVGWCVWLFQGESSGAGGAPVIEKSPISVVDLRCEGEAEPVGLDVAMPQLAWKLVSPERGQYQTAYQIQAASSRAALEADAPDLWDTGRVESRALYGLRYAGKPLGSNQEVWWRVRVWDRAGRVSEWSPSARWVTGLLDANRWHAKWIAARTNVDSVLFRREFVLKSKPVRALVHVSGLGHYVMFLNGCRVGDRQFTPGWTLYSKTVLYDTYEVTEYLCAGTNAVGLMLGPGMYHVVRRGRFSKFEGSFGPLRAICQIHVWYADGTEDVFVTDDAWRVHPGPITFCNIYGGEDFDARLVQPGWSRPGFDDSGWAAAVGVEPGTARMYGFAHAPSPVRIIETNRAVSIRRLDGSARWLVDLGQNAAHMPWIKVGGARGTRFRIRPGEILNPDGSVNQRTMGAKPERGYYWCEFVKSTDEPEEWYPIFWYVGCRYLEIEAEPVVGEVAPEVISAAGWVVHADVRPVGRFECSDELLNRIRRLVRWAQRSNMMSVFTDCPHREKLGWLEQYHLNGPALRFEFDVARTFRKTMRDMADSQTEDGLVPNIAPEYTRFKGAFRAAAEWGSAVIQVPWQQYIFCGDTNLLREYYPVMSRYLAYLESRATNEILGEGLGDWYDLGPNRPGAAQLTPPELTATAFLFYDNALMARIATILGQTNDAARFYARAMAIRRAFNARFYDQERGVYGAGSDAANAIALAMGLVEPREKQRVLSTLISTIKERGYMTTAGDVGFRFLLRALADNGRSDLVYRIVTQQDRPGYAYQLKLGETSLTEAWDANPTSSHNHFMLGQVVEWLYHDLGGIQPDPTRPGFEHVIINPAYLPALDWVEVEYDSVRGRIAVRWQRSGGELVTKVHVPVGATATVLVPGTSPELVRESGKPISGRDDLRVVGVEFGRVRIEVGSGEYEFVSCESAVRNGMLCGGRPGRLKEGLDFVRGGGIN